MAQRTCERCSLTFTVTRSTQRFCSPQCRIGAANARQLAKRKPPPQTGDCAVCGATFQRKRSDSRTCSTACRTRSYYKPRDRWHAKTCTVCGATFRSKRSDAVYCGRTCFTRLNYDSAATTARAQSWAAKNREAVRAIKLRYKIKRRDVELASPGVSNRDWLRLLNRYDYRCAYCGIKPVRLHMDHVVPLMRGGKHQIGNVLPACADCNLSKSARLLAAWKRGRSMAAWSQDAPSPLGIRPAPRSSISIGWPVQA